jgi:tetratricopeptide (TPR) repeat protein
MDDEPVTASDYFHKGVDHLEHGELDKALECVNRAIERNYFGADIALVKGEILFEMGKPDESLGWFTRAVEMDESLATEATLWRARVFFEKRQYGRSLSALNRVIEQSPMPAEAYFLKGLVLSERGDYLKAMEALAESRALVGDSDERLADILVWEGRCLHRMRREEEGIARLEKALTIAPDFIEAYAELGEMYRAQGRLDQACQSYRRGLRIHPGDASLCNDYGNALRDLGRLDESLEQLNLAIENDKRQTIAIFNRAITHERMGKWDEALADYSKVVEADPKDAEARLRRMDIHSRLERFDEAYREFEGIPEAERKSEDAEEKLARLMNRHARALEAAGKQGEALSLYAKILKLHPEFLDLDNPGKHFGSAADRHERSLEQLSAIPDSHPDVALLPLIRAEVCLRLGDHKKARLHANQAMSGPHPELAHLVLADLLYHDHNDPKAALDEVAAALKIRPKFVKALWLRVGIQAEGTRDAPGAIATYHELLHLVPDNPAVLQELADYYYDLGEVYRALVCYRMLQDTLPGDGGVQREIAMCYLGLGRTSEAIAELKRIAQAGDPDLSCRVALADALLRGGEDPAAAELLNEVEQLNEGLDPSVDDACRELRAVLLNRQKRHKKALDVLARVPDDELSDIGLLQRGIAFARLELNEKAVACFARLIEDAPPGNQCAVAARLEIAKIARATGNLKDAVTALEELLAIDPYHWRARTLLVWMLRESGRAEDADAQENAVTIYRELETGRRFMLTDQFTDASEALREFVAKYPQFSGGYYWFAAAQCRLGQYVSATAAMKRVLEIEPRLLDEARGDPFFEGFAFSELLEYRGGDGDGAKSDEPGDDEAGDGGAAGTEQQN